jgi:diguanylate cyclase (GGDEF)-like protein
MREFSRVRSADCGSFIVDRRGTILGFDLALEELTGWPAVQVVGRHKDLARSMRAEEEGGTSRIVSAPFYDGEIRLADQQGNLSLTLNCRDGRTLDVEAAATRLGGPGERMLVQVLRVNAISAGEPAREDATRRDPLTALPNAEAFAVRLASEFNTAAATARPLALIRADVDHLIEINDRLGHEAGDEVLRSVAGILRVRVEDDSRLCRLGDDDFAVILPEAGRGEARQFAASLRSTVERHRFFETAAGEPDLPVTLSLGAASFPADADNASDLMDRAQDALDEARSMGRNRVWCYLRRPRVPVQVPVFFEGAEALLVGYTRDLSPSGIFVQTSVPVDIGMRCALNFPLPGHDGKVHVIGRVVRTVPPETSTGAQDLRIPGMGVEFERFGGSTDRRAIESFLHDNESKTLRPENGILSV